MGQRERAFEIAVRSGSDEGDGGHTLGLLRERGEAVGMCFQGS